MKLKDLKYIVTQSFKEWSQDKASQLAAALAYYTIFSIPPLLILTIAIAVQIFDRSTVQQQILTQIADLVGSRGAEAVRIILENASEPGTSTAAAIISAATLLLGASGVFGQLHDALNTIWEIQPKPGRGVIGTIKDRFFSFTMVLGVGFLLLVSLIISTVLAAFNEFVSNAIPGLIILAQAINSLVSFGVITVLFALIFKVVPDVKITWRDVWIGAVVTAALFTVGKWGIGLYLGNSTPGSTYGAAGSLIVLLLWIYYSTQILFLGAEFTQVYANKLGSRIVPDESAMRLTQQARQRQGMERPANATRTDISPVTTRTVELPRGRSAETSQSQTNQARSSQVENAMQRFHQFTVGTLAHLLVVWQILTQFPLALARMVSMAVWQPVRTMRSILRQPRLIWQHAPDVPVKPEEVSAHGLSIAAVNVKHCIEPRHLLNGEEKLVLCAGVRNFREPWARDFGFSAFGLISLGEQQVVKECLEAFLYYQTEAGQFPVKIHSTSILERYLHSLLKREQPIKKPLRPKYKTAHRTISLDGNCLLVIAALHYVQETADFAFLRRHWDELCRAIAWLENRASSEDGLLHQGTYTDWADSIARTGRILYTNVLYWKAVTDLAAASVHCADGAEQAIWQRKAEQLYNQIQTHFWREDLGYFITSERFHSLSSSGNTMAVVWGLATEPQAHAILDAMDWLEMADPVPTQVVSQPYRRRDVAVENRLAGIPEYHVHAAWLWLGGWHILALTKMGRLEEAETLVQRMSEVIVRDGVVHEVYGQNGRFLSTLLYTSEAPLTWSASMVVYAITTFMREQFRSTRTGND